MITPVNRLDAIPQSRVAADRAVPALAALGWLQKGLQDFRRVPGLSLLYGAVFALASAGVFLLATGFPVFAPGYLSGLVVAGPFLAAGLYAASREIERGRAPSISASLRLIDSRKTYLALFSLLLALTMAAWVRLSALLFAIKFNTLSPPIEAYLGLLASPDGWVTLGYFFAIGALLAIAVFAFSAVAIPSILDRDADFISATINSIRTVLRNPAAMAVWAGLIALFTALGVATAFIGFVAIFPILGYATWHSYRELVSEHEASA